MRRKVLFELITIALCLGIHVSAYGQMRPDLLPPVVTVEHTPEGVNYQINSKDIPKKDGLFLSLSNVHDAAREKQPNAQDDATLMVHEKIDVRTIINVLGIMAKAGYVNPRILCYDKDKNIITELKFSKPVPFSSGVVPKVKNLGGVPAQQ